jgi:hypothetical protein
VTTTAARARQRQRQPGPQPARPAAAPPVTTAQLQAAVVTALAGPAAAVPVALTVALRPLFKAAGISVLALAVVAALVAFWPTAPVEGIGHATRWAVRVNTARRAAFFVAAARRVQAAIDNAAAHGESLQDAAIAAMGAEQRYLAQHVAASAQRLQAAAAVDGAVAMHGALLGWNTWLDARTSPGCRRANGRNFRVDQPPIIEGQPSYPGTVHVGCRCWPSAPHRGAPVMR